MSNIEVLNNLVNLADHLDKVGQYKIANRVTHILKSAALPPDIDIAYDLRLENGTLVGRIELRTDSGEASILGIRIDLSNPPESIEQGGITAELDATLIDERMGELGQVYTGESTPQELEDMHVRHRNDRWKEFTELENKVEPLSEKESDRYEVLQNYLDV